MMSHDACPITPLAAAQSMVLEDSEEGEEEVILDSQEKHSGQAQGGGS